MSSQYKLFLSLLVLASLWNQCLFQEVAIQIIDYDSDGNEVLSDNGFTISNEQNIPEGFPSVPAEYQNQNQDEDTYIYPALQLGAQFLAAQAVADGVFTTSVCNVTQVYSFVEVVPSTFYQETPDYNIQDEGTQYKFDVELQSANNETTRVNFVVLVDTNSFSYLVKSYNFEYLADYEGQIDELEVAFVNDVFDYNIFAWNDNIESNLFNTEAVLVDGLPETGESFEYDANLLVNNWVRVNVDDRLNNDDFLYVLKYGANYTLSQGFAYLTIGIESVDQFSVYQINNVFERNGTNGTDFKFDLSSFSQDSQTIRMNYQLNYNANASSLYLYSWAIESMINPLI